MHNAIHIKIYVSLAFVPLTLTSFYAIASEEKKERLLPLRVETKQQVQQKEHHQPHHNRNIAIDSLWTAAWTAATAVSAYYAASSEELEYLYKVRNIGPWWCYGYCSCYT